MSVDSNKVNTIRGILMGVAAKEQTITYDHLSKLVGIHRQNLGVYLNTIYQMEMEEDDDRPDVTLVVVGSGKPSLPRFFDGNQMKMDDWTTKDLRQYHNRLDRVYKHYDSTN